MDNEKLTKALEACQSKEEVLKVLAENGIEITAEELDKLIKTAQSDGELDEGALENVAGGAGITTATLLWMLRKTLVVTVPVPAVFRK